MGRTTFPHAEGQMKATERTLQQILHAPDQYVIPNLPKILHVGK
jgi:hypothetical protein